MKKIPVLIMGLALFVIAITGCTKKTIISEDSSKLNNFRAAMRVLWSEHVVWTRNVIINIVDGAPGSAEAVSRLLQNQVDIGNGIKPYYGDAGGSALTALLHNHIVVASDLITAAKGGDIPAYSYASTKWYLNGDSIATFLNTANPTHFHLADWQMMMKHHLDLTIIEVNARVNNDYAGDVIAYDNVFTEMMKMSDMLAEGIALQFPQSF